MAKARTIGADVVELWRTLSRKRRRQLYLILLIMVAASFAEIFSLGLIVPFLAMITAPQKVLGNQLVSHALLVFGIQDQSEAIIAMAVAFCIATLIAAGVRLLLLYASTGFSFALGADISLEVYRRTLYQPYPVHVSRNSSDVINGVIRNSNEVTLKVVIPLLTVVSAAFLVAGILAALLAISAAVTLAAAAAFVAIYGGVILLTRRRIRRDSVVVARESPQVLKALQEGLGGIRDVLLDGTQETFTDIYRVADRRMRAAEGRMILTAGSPRFLVEGLGMIFIALLAVAVSRGGGGSDAVPVLGALALGAQRLLPVVQQAYAALVTIRGTEASLHHVVGLLRQPMPEVAVSGDALPFADSVRLEGVRFAYAGAADLVLDGIDLEIKKGTRVGIFGPTGGGKSTLLDILMGLLDPTGGTISVDGVNLDSGTRRAWQMHVAHVPQSIYLSDASIAENVAFGLPAGAIDMARVREAVRVAQLLPVIEKLPEGFLTLVGERGVRLSGGQRQRLGIARALYKRADVIVFDEATSALDLQTEEELMTAINGLSHDLTIIMVAHRLSTLRECDEVFEIAAGRIVRRGSYADLIERPNENARRAGSVDH